MIRWLISRLRRKVYSQSSGPVAFVNVTRYQKIDYSEIRI